MLLAFLRRCLLVARKNILSRYRRRDNSAITQAVDLSSMRVLVEPVICICLSGAAPCCHGNVLRALAAPHLLILYDLYQCNRICGTGLKPTNDPKETQYVAQP
jgi:hypothetical protein